MITHPNITTQISPKQKLKLVSLYQEKNTKALFNEYLILARSGIDFSFMFEDEEFLTYSKTIMKTHLSSRTGNIYAAKHELISNKVKIGLSRRDPMKRLKELTTSGIPGQFELLIAVKALDAFYVESEIHQHFKQQRFDREIFSVEESDAINIIKQFSDRDNYILTRRLFSILPIGY